MPQSETWRWRPDCGSESSLTCCRGKSRATAGTDGDPDPAPGAEVATRALVEGYGRCGGNLRDGVLELAVGRHFNIQPNRPPLQPYPEAEWQQLTDPCRRLVDDSYAAHRRALIAVGHGCDPNESGWTWENFCWLMARLGPLGTPEVARATGASHNVLRRRGVPVFCEALQAVFPYLDVVIAYRLLFGVYSGIVPDGIADLGVDEIEWVGDSTILLSYVKRRTAGENLNLPKNAVRLLEQWLAHSALLRSRVGHADRDRLWLGMSLPGNPHLIRTVDRNATARWVRRYGLTGTDGKPLRIQRARIRTVTSTLSSKCRH